MLRDTVRSINSASDTEMSPLCPCITGRENVQSWQLDSQHCSVCDSSSCSISANLSSKLTASIWIFQTHKMLFSSKAKGPRAIYLWLSVLWLFQIRRFDAMKQQKSLCTLQQRAQEFKDVIWISIISQMTEIKHKHPTIRTLHVKVKRND